MKLALAVLLVAAPALADRPLHGSIGAGPSLALTGARGDHARYDIAFDFKPRSRYGITLGWRQVDADRRGLAVAGLVFEGAAARPRLVLDLHVDAGIDLDDILPLAGAGVRATLMIKGPLAIVFDLAGYLVLDDIDNSRLQLASSALLALKF